MVANSIYYSATKEPILSTTNVLKRLKDEVQKKSGSISIMVLRAMHDVGMSAYKEFENTSLEEAINKVTAMLYHSFPDYKMLEPLGRDFWKGGYGEM